MSDTDTASGNFPQRCFLFFCCCYSTVGSTAAQVRGRCFRCHQVSEQILLNSVSVYWSCLASYCTVKTLQRSLHLINSYSNNSCGIYTYVFITVSIIYWEFETSLFLAVDWIAPHVTIIVGKCFAKWIHTIIYIPAAECMWNCQKFMMMNNLVWLIDWLFIV